MKPVTGNDILKAFRNLGIVPGDTLMVHTSLSAIG